METETNPVVRANRGQPNISSYLSVSDRRAKGTGCSALRPMPRPSSGPAATRALRPPRVSADMLRRIRRAYGKQNGIPKIALLGELEERGTRYSGGQEGYTILQTEVTTVQKNLAVFGGISTPNRRGGNRASRE